MNKFTLEYALLDLTPDLASLALRRIAVLKEQRNLDPDIDETYYWAYFVDCYFDPWAESAEDVKEGEGTNSAVGDMLDELKIEDNGVVSVPENFHVAPSQYAAVESEQMVVRPMPLRSWLSRNMAAFASQLQKSRSLCSKRRQRQRVNHSRPTFLHYLLVLTCL